MKTILSVVILILSFSISNYALSQCDCNAALSSDLLSVSSEYNESSFRKFIYQYFKSSKKERKKMKKNYSNSFGLKAVVDGLPIEFSSDNNSGSDAQRFYSFEQEILKNDYVSSEMMQSISTRYMSTNQLTAYLACLKSSCGSQNGVTSEVGGDPFDVFFVRITFTNDLANVSIKLDTDIQYAGCSPIHDLVMEKGVELKSGQSLVQYFKRSNPDKAASVNVNFDQLALDPIQLAKRDNNNTALPIGSIVTSTLSFSEFHQQVTDKAFTADQSIWAPCDGRKVIGSSYSTNFQKDFVPDLRGQFLRGQNSMGGPSEADQATPNGKNPRDGETKKNGYVYQEDGIAAHKHVTNLYQQKDDSGRGGAANDLTVGGSGYNKTSENNIGAANETRPMNMYVYYYIRIN